jgi:hypothetical protein
VKARRGGRKWRSAGRKKAGRMIKQRNGKEKGKGELPRGSGDGDEKDERLSNKVDQNELKKREKAIGVTQIRE